MTVAPLALLEADGAAVDVQKRDARNDKYAKQNADNDANGGIELVGCRSWLEPGGTVIHDGSPPGLQLLTELVGNQLEWRS